MFHQTIFPAHLKENNTHFQLSFFGILPQLDSTVGAASEREEMACINNAARSLTKNLAARSGIFSRILTANIRGKPENMFSEAIIIMCRVDEVTKTEE